MSTKKIECQDKKLQVLELEPKDEWSYHFWFGLKCGYPLCCIIWFCDSQLNQGIQWDGLYEKIYREAYDSQPKAYETRVSYSQCPECLARSIPQ